MKKFIKTIVSLTAASAMLLSTTAFAVTTKTVTKYSANGTTVTSTVSGLTEGSMVTYLAHKDKDVSANGDNIVYIDQKTVGSSKSAQFEYAVTDVTDAGVYATVKYGSNKDAIASTDKFEVGKVTVVFDKTACAVTGETKVGFGDTTSLTIDVADNYEVVAIKVDNEQKDPANRAITVTAGQTVTITTAATNAKPAVYQLVGAKLEAQDGYKYVTKDGKQIYKNAGIVRVIGEVDKLYFTFNDGQYKMGTEVADGHFVVDGIVANGYYGVEIEDTVDVSKFSVKAHAVVDTEEIDAIEIQ